ncbi:MAG: domain of cyanobacterial aminoacyl-tRNA synthetase [Cyanobacteriota bacterium]
MSVPTEQEQTPAVTAEETAVVDTPEPEPVVAEPVVAQPPVAEPLVAEASAPEPVAIPVATPAPLATPAPQPAPAAAASPDAETARLLGLPLQLINQLLARLGAAPLHNLTDLLPALRLVSLLVVAGITIKLTGATLGAINELPLVGRLLELVGLISALQFLAANALRSQKRAELLARIQKLKQDFLG